MAAVCSCVEAGFYYEAREESKLIWLLIQLATCLFGTKYWLDLVSEQ